MLPATLVMHVYAKSWVSQFSRIPQKSLKRPLTSGQVRREALDNRADPPKPWLPDALLFKQPDLAWGGGAPVVSRVAMLLCFSDLAGCAPAVGANENAAPARSIRQPPPPEPFMLLGLFFVLFSKARTVPRFRSATSVGHLYNSSARGNLGIPSSKQRGQALRRLVASYQLFPSMRLASAASLIFSPGCTHLNCASQSPPATAAGTKQRLSPWKKQIP